MNVKPKQVQIRDENAMDRENTARFHGTQQMIYQNPEVIFALLPSLLTAW